MPTSRRYVVIGAGHGGKAMAAHLALMGCQVTLYNRTAERVAAIKARGGSTWKTPTVPAALAASTASPRIWRKRWQKRIW